MARSLSNVKIVCGALAATFSLAGRGFAAAATQTARSPTEGRSKAAGVEEQEHSWVPDPVTGYYRPENRGEKIDVAELREMLLSNKKVGISGKA